MHINCDAVEADIEENTKKFSQIFINLCHHLRFFEGNVMQFNEDQSVRANAFKVS